MAHQTNLVEVDKTVDTKTFLPSTSHFLILGKGREKGRKKEEKECWRGRREYYAFRDKFAASRGNVNFYLVKHKNGLRNTPKRLHDNESLHRGDAYYSL